MRDDVDTVSKNNKRTGIMRFDTVKKALQQKGYEVICFECASDAADHLNRVIDEKTVGFGDSMTLTKMQLYRILSTHNQVYDPQHGLDFIETAKRALTAQVFLTSANALSETGEIVNLDGTGNRTAGSLFGHETVYFVIGSNKIAPTLEDAVWRTRNIAAPQNARRFHLNTPCAKQGDRCYDCASPERICNGMVIHLRKMNDTDMKVLLIDEPLGL